MTRSIYDHLGVPSKRHHKELLKLTEPIKTYFGIDRFWRNTHRVDGFYSVLGNHPPAAEFFFENKLFVGHPYFRSPIFFQSGYVLPDLLHNEEYERTQGRLKKEGDCFHVLIIIAKHKDRVIEYGLATSKPILGFEMHYLNHMKALRKFLAYFEESAEKIINAAEDYSIDLPPLIGKKYQENPKIPGILVPENELKFLTAIGIQGRGLDTLTECEKSCLKLYILGNTSKEIGKLLFRSHRTIESHLETAKMKLNLKTRSELTNFLMPFIDHL